jgi:adenylylsulfate kinase
MSQDSKLTNQHVVWHEPTVFRADREKLNAHRSAILWFTGLSGAGKSTLAHGTEETLHKRGIRTFVLDGDNVRRGLCKDLGFSDADRTENIRRIGEVAKLMLDAGVLVMTAFISPFRNDRALARSLVAEGDFIEIYCNADLATCEKRDPKGLYRKARAGQIPEFTGISSPYEAPEHPEIVVDTGGQSIEACIDQIIAFLTARKYLR